MNTEPNNWPKLIVAVVTVICITVLMSVDKVSDEAGLPAICLIAGYILNNGLQAVQKRKIITLENSLEKEVNSNG